MKKCFLNLFLLFAFAIASNAQQLPLYSQYMFNGFLLNPGIAGSVDYFPIRITARQQWVGIKDAPSTQAISAHYLMEQQKLGIGGFIFNDKFGPLSETGIQLSAAYHLPLEGINSKLGLGLAFKAFQFKFDESDLVTIDENDMAVSHGKITKFVPDADFGAYLYNDKYYVGVSATQLIQFKIDLGDSNAVDKNKIIRHYYSLAGYRFSLSEDFELEPSLLFKGTFQSPWQVDINAKAIYRSMYWFGLSYRSSKDLVAMLGLKVKKFYIGYAFDYTFTSIKNYSNGSHEILIGFNVFEGKNKGSSLL
ncbi:MAG TPA: type IX secretion system membrane protein PorP/SprF [Bacteroidales bacterium]|jgi:type IX secretion system PorP/SprF family membrane protein|nr:type IX secretion system membrane protein PorP/SprF [Bacteroidales bacterium]